jgi:O-acetylhomoserine (thiol)-lyase
VIVDGATFDYSDSARWPGFSSPIGQNPAGYWERFSGRGLAYSLRLRTTVLRDYGPAVSPFNSFLLIQGLETLSLRMRQHVANARDIVAFLQAHPLVEKVHYPEARGSQWSELAARYLPRGAGAIVSFEITGGREAGATFVESLRLFSHLANIGDVRSLVIHPASTTHSGMTPEQQRVAGISPSLVRLSIGLEDSADLVADLERALAASAPITSDR